MFEDPDPGAGGPTLFVLEDPTVNYFNSAKLPVCHPALGLFGAPFPGQEVVITGNFGQGFGALSRFYLVPEPSTFSLLFACLRAWRA